jgi:DNA-binding LytR/AlgR family response regulator
VTVEDEIVTKERISKIIDRLPSHFIRIHRSFIVNSHKITSYNKEAITLDSFQIPISRTYKEEVITYLEEKL